MANEERQFSFTTRTTQVGEKTFRLGPSGDDLDTKTNAIFENGTLKPDYTTIPGSAIHRWTFSEGSGTTVSDSIGTADGTVNGASWVSGTSIGDYALDGDGTNDYINVGTLGTFGSNLGSSWAIALSFSSLFGIHRSLLHTDSRAFPPAMTGEG